MLHLLKKILMLLMPIVAIQLIDAVAGVTDAVMLGHYSATMVGFSMMAQTIFWFPMVCIMGFALLSSALIGQAKGADNPQMTIRVIQATATIIVLLGMVSAVGLWHVDVFLNILQYDKITSVMINDYIDGRLLGVTFLLAIPYQMYLIHYGWGRFAFIIKACTIPLNIFLNWVCIYGNLGVPEMGIYGAGLATAISSVIITTVSVLFATLHARKNGIFLWQNFRIIDIKTQKLIYVLGAFLTLSFIAEMILFTNLTLYVGYYDVIVISAFGLLMNLWMLAFSTQQGMGEACKAYMAQVAGRRNKLELHQALGIFFVLVLVIDLVTAVVCIVYAKPILTPMITSQDTNTPAIIIVAVNSIPYLVGAFCIQSFVRIIYSLLTALNDTKFMAIAMIGIYTTIGAGLGYIFVFHTDYGLLGILLTMIVADVVVLAVAIFRMRMVLTTPNVFERIVTD